MLVVAAVVVVSAGPMLAADDSAALRKPPRGSLARRLRLKMKLRKIAGGNLSESLRHNRLQWQNLSPDQRGRYRRSFLAFLKKNPDRQDELLEHFEKLFKMSDQRRQAYRQRAKWLRIVIKSFTPDQREQMRKLTPDQRAKKLLARKALLISQGKLKPDQPPAKTPDQPAPAPTTQPASAPTTQPGAVVRAAQP